MGKMSRAVKEHPEDPLNACPNPPEGYRQVMYTEGRLKELCGGWLIALYTDGNEDCTEPMLIDRRLLPEKLQEHGDYVELVIAVRGKIGTP